LRKLVENSSRKGEAGNARNLFIGAGLYSDTADSIASTNFQQCHWRTSRNS